ncbi:MAG: DUF4266 domain-containing protein [Pseudomonadota bacterium]
MLRPLRLTALAGLSLCVLCTGCTTVKAWEKGYVAREEMAFAPDPLAEALSDHVFFSKEASTSGSLVSGSGCGCN